MNGGSIRWVVVVLTQDLSYDRGSVPSPEQEATHDVQQGTALGPFEVGVRALASNVAQGDQDRRDRVRHGGTLRTQHTVATDLGADHVKHLSKLRRVDDLDLEEEHVRAAGHGIQPALRALLLEILRRLSGLGPIGDEVQAAVVPARPVRRSLFR